MILAMASKRIVCIMGMVALAFCADASAPKGAGAAGDIAEQLKAAHSAVEEFGKQISELLKETQDQEKITKKLHEKESQWLQNEGKEIANIGLKLLDTESGKRSPVLSQKDIQTGKDALNNAVKIIESTSAEFRSIKDIKTAYARDVASMWHAVLSSIEKGVKERNFITKYVWFQPIIEETGKPFNDEEKAKNENYTKILNGLLNINKFQNAFKAQLLTIVDAELANFAKESGKEESVIAFLTALGELVGAIECNSMMYKYYLEEAPLNYRQNAPNIEHCMGSEEYLNQIRDKIVKYQFKSFLSGNQDKIAEHYKDVVAFYDNLVMNHIFDRNHFMHKIASSADFAEGDLEKVCESSIATLLEIYEEWAKVMIQRDAKHATNTKAAEAIRNIRGLVKEMCETQKEIIKEGVLLIRSDKDVSEEGRGKLHKLAAITLAIKDLDISNGPALEKTVSAAIEKINEIKKAEIVALNPHFESAEIDLKNEILRSAWNEQVLKQMKTDASKKSMRIFFRCLDTIREKIADMQGVMDETVNIDDIYISDVPTICQNAVLAVFAQKLVVSSLVSANNTGCLKPLLLFNNGVYSTVSNVEKESFMSQPKFYLSERDTAYVVKQMMSLIKKTLAKIDILSVKSSALSTDALSEFRKHICENSTEPEKVPAISAIYQKPAFSAMSTKNDGEEYFVKMRGLIETLGNSAKLEGSQLFTETAQDINAGIKIILSRISPGYKYREDILKETKKHFDAIMVAPAFENKPLLENIEMRDILYYTKKRSAYITNSLQLIKNFVKSLADSIANKSRETFANFMDSIRDVPRFEEDEEETVDEKVEEKEEGFSRTGLLIATIPVVLVCGAAFAMFYSRKQEA